MISGRCSILLSAVRYVTEFSKHYSNNNGPPGIIVCSESFFQTINRRQIERSRPNKFPTISARMASSSHDDDTGKQQQLLMTTAAAVAAAAAAAASPTEQKNKLALEKSPYLLQHASNPVQWYPWGDEALEIARREDKLIFLSVGYSTCHWCHVMERESFENPETAKIMNRYFVNIKVDREERPDIDKIYMTFIQTISGHGGWPMNVFITPDLVPVTGGTYFPPTDKYGQLGFEKILLTVAHKWLENKRDLLKSGSRILEVLKESATSKTSLSVEKDIPSIDCGKTCVEQLVRSYDREFGGFTDSPKFPQPVNLNLLFHVYSRDPTSELGKKCLDMCLHTLTKMANGGIHDHVGQGFARYSVDGKWHVPHFEKMLYDQGQLLRSYADAYLATKDRFYANILDDIITYITRDLRHRDGGFYSAEDADSLATEASMSKREGAFYVWTFDEIETHLDMEIPQPNSPNLRLCDIFSYHYHVQKDGNVKKYQDPHGELTGQNVLIVYGSVDETANHFDCSVKAVEKYLSESLKILFEARATRPRPHLDDKIVTAWNGLVISGLSQAGAATKNKKYVDYAEDAAKFVERHLYDEKKGILLRSCYRGAGDVITQLSVPINGFHVDYAFFVKGLLDLYEASLNDHWLAFAEELQDIQDKLFWDSANGGYYNTTMHDTSIILRLKDDTDGAEPSGNSIACENLLRLSSCFDRPDLKDKASQLLVSFHQLLTRIPAAVPELVSALLHYHDSTTQIFIAGKRDAKDTDELVDVVRERLIPAKALLLVDPEDTDGIVFRKNEITGKMKAQTGRATAYVCRHHTCSLPVADPSQLADLLDSRKSVGRHIMLLASGISIGTIAGAIEEEEYVVSVGAVNSEANSSEKLNYYDGYVTDHTDLGSEIDIDESEYRRELLNDRWRVLFDKFDPEGFGEIPLDDFMHALKSLEWQAEIPSNKRDILLVRVKESRMQAVTFQDFVNVMSGKRTRSFKCAVHHRDREVCSENDFHILVNEPPLFRRMVRMIGDEFLTEERDRKFYADHYTCCPPPLFIILITLVELAFFTYYTVVKGEVNSSGPVPTDSVFIYRPDKRLELWRFAFYMFLHAGWLHLLFNLGVQLVVGLPLEMVHGSLRIAAVYMAGVLAGSLGTSVFDTDVYLVGASGGVYALLAAHLANVLLNYNNMEFGIVRLVGIFIIASADVGFAIYDRYAEEQMGPPVSYVAHLTGALAGLTIGLLVLKNFEQRLHEQLLWWVALGVYAACTIFAIMYNLMHPDYP